MSILEALMNADMNLQTAIPQSYSPITELAKEQLHNAVTLLDKGYSLYDQVEPLLEKFGDVDRVPDKET